MSAATSQNELQAELHRTRVLLRDIVEAFVDDDWTLTGELADWYREEVNRPRVDA